MNTMTLMMTMLCDVVVLFNNNLHNYKAIRVRDAEGK
jgi:hypothetical protein